MSEVLRSAFEQGSGVDPRAFRLMVQLLATGVIVMVFAWVNLQIFQSYRNDRCTAADAIWSSLKATAILSTLFVVVFR